MNEKILKQESKEKNPEIGFWLRNVKVVSIFVGLLFLLLTVFGSFEVYSVQTQYSLRQFFPVFHPLLRQDALVKNKFKLEDSPFLIVLRLPPSAGQDWLTTKRLQGLKKLTQSLQKLGKVKSVQSLANLSSATQNRGELGIGAIIDHLSGAELRQAVKTNPLLSPLLISQDLRTLTIFVSSEILDNKETEILKTKLVEVSQKALPFSTVTIGGVPAIQSDVSEILDHEIGRFVGVAVLLSLAALMLVFRNFYPVLICTALGFVSNIISIWAITIFGFSLNVLSATIPILVTMSVISICIHSILRLIERCQLLETAQSYLQLVILTFRELFRPNLLTALTTSVGFFTLTLSDSPIIKEFGFSVGIALLVCWLTTAVLLPVLLWWSPRPELRAWMAAKARWPFFILRFNKTVLASVVLLAVWSAWNGQNLSWKARLFDDLPKDHEVRKTTELVDQSMGGVVPLDIEIRWPKDPSPWAQPSALRQLDSLAARIREKAGVGSLLTMADLLRTTGMLKGSAKASIPEVLFLMSMNEQNPLPHFLSADGQSTRLAIRLHDISGGRMWNLVQEIRKATQQEFPQGKVRIAGTAAFVHDINNSLSKDLLYGFWQAMLVIFILLALVYRSLVWSVLACLPNLIPPSLLLGVLAWWQTPIKPGIAIVLSIALGLAFNNTVYLLERFRQLIEKGHSYQKALNHTFWSETNPCLFSSVVLAVGFAGFFISYFKMNQQFGVFMVLSVIAGLLGDLVMLPALLQFVEKLGGVYLTRPFLEKKTAVTLSLALVLGFAFSPESFAKSGDSGNLQQLGERMLKRIRSRDEVGKISLKIIEADGTSRLREISYSRLNLGQTHYAILRMLSPKDIKDTALLSVITGSQEDRWIYLPSSKQTRKITSSDSSSRIMDSELYSDDFEIGNIKGLASRILSSEKDGTTVIETKFAATKSSYSKSVVWVGKDDLVKKAEVYDQKGALLKRVEFSHYLELPGGKMRADRILITNLQNHRKTELKLSAISLEQKLSKKDFTPRALAEKF